MDWQEVGVGVGAKPEDGGVVGGSSDGACGEFWGKS